MGCNIAIDGPAGAGKSTIAKKVAKELSFIYVDTGAMYRAMALYLLNHGVNGENQEEIETVCSGADISIEYKNGEQIVILNGENVNAMIRTEQVGNMASKSSANPKVRAHLLKLQRTLAEKNDVVMDGRDIGTTILPNAEENRQNMASKILYVCQEITPYLPETENSRLCRALTQAMQERGNEIRTFMPRYGCINERRHQLHEVIRLSGMNLIIDDNDHQLIIKVASIPSARVQIYFIDNDDYFSRKAVLTDAGGNYFADNDERSIFFARGVLETVKKLRWTPSIVHCHGWFSSVVPVYLKHVFADDPIFRDVKIVVSLYGDGFPGSLDSGFADKIAGEGVKDKNLGIIADPSYENLCRFVMEYADGVVAASAEVDPRVLEIVRESGKPMLEYQSPDAEDFFDNYNRFYEAIQ